MTGFESWVKAGLELGAAAVLEALETVLEANPDLPTDDNYIGLHKLVAAELQKRWPPWKVAAQVQPDLAGLMGKPAQKKPAGKCSHCGRDANLLLGSAEGPVCRQCFDSYMRREWP